MTDTNKPVDLDELERLAREDDTDDWWCSRCRRRVPGAQITYEEVHEICGCTASEFNPAFPIAMRNAIPAMIAELRQARKVEAALEACLAKCIGKSDYMVWANSSVRVMLAAIGRGEGPQK